jgi:hypothetical protein
VSASTLEELSDSYLQDQLGGVQAQNSARRTVVYNGPAATLYSLRNCLTPQSPALTCDWSAFAEHRADVRVEICGT